MEAFILVCVIIALIGWAFYITFWFGTGVLLLMVTLFVLGSPVEKSTRQHFQGTYTSANRYNDNQDYQKANEFYSNAFLLSRNHRDSVKALGGLIVTYEKLGEYEAAKYFENKLKRIDSNNAWLKTRSGRR